MFSRLDLVWSYLVGDLLGISLESKLGESLWYFMHSASTIIILLFIGISIITFIRTFISTSRIKKFIETHSGVKANLMASLLGVITPFCSCSSVPIFISFIEARIPLGVVFSFLITSPIVNEAAFLILLTTFGWKVAGLYAISGISIGVLGGLLIGKLKMEKYVEDYVYNMKLDSKEDKTFEGFERVSYSLKEALNIIKGLLPYMVVGIGVGAFIHGWVPTDLITKIGTNQILSVPIATLIGIPLYTDAAGIIPIATSLVTKGLGIGTTMAFMMAAVALSLPEMMLLKKVIKVKLIGTFIAIVGTGIILVGYLFNVVTVI